MPEEKKTVVLVANVVGVMGIVTKKYSEIDGTNRGRNKCAEVAENITDWNSLDTTESAKNIRGVTLIPW